MAQSMLEISRKVARNSRPPDLARSVADLIASWRAEISEKKNYGTTIATEPLTEWFRRASPTGITATLGAYTILACEWTFRVRRATEEDIEQVLSAMERSLCSPEKRILSRFHAHLLIKALEGALRKQMNGVRIPIALGFSSESAFSSYDWSKTRREVPKRVIPTKRGRLPIAGPILAGVVIDALDDGKLGKEAAALGQDLCSILLERRVLEVEFSDWRKMLWARTFAGHPLPVWIGQRIRNAHRRIFEQDGHALDRFLRACQTNPAEFLSSLSDPEIVRVVFSVEWGRSKNPVSVGGKKGRVSGVRSLD